MAKSKLGTEILRRASYLKKNGIIFEKTNGITIKKTVSHFKMIGNALFSHFVQKNYEIENSKNMGGLRSMSRYRINHKMRVPFIKISVSLMPD